MKTKQLDTFKGCLFGGAIGDALGYAVEFSNIEQIREQYGESGIRSLQLVDGKALISDDTQLTLFTANGILTGRTRERLTGDSQPIDRALYNAYMDWHRTQRLTPRSEAGSISSWIYHDKRMHSVRAPGGTCLRSLSSGIMGTMEHPINTSKGCGGVMRVSPIALYFDPVHNSQRDIDMLGARSAALTHGHPLGFISAAALVHIISLLAYGDFSGEDALSDVVRDCVRALGETFGEYVKTVKLQTLLQNAIALSSQNGSDTAAIASLGEGWVAEEAVAIAVYCALKYHDDFERALVASVNHSGDSDSTGAITGSILGTLLGYDRIPNSLIDDLELFDMIREIAEDLYLDSASDDIAHCRSDEWQRKYGKADYRLPSSK